MPAVNALQSRVLGLTWLCPVNHPGAVATDMLQAAASRPASCLQMLHLHEDNLKLTLCMMSLQTCKYKQLQKACLQAQLCSHSICHLGAACSTEDTPVCTSSKYQRSAFVVALPGRISRLRRTCRFAMINFVCWSDRRLTKISAADMQPEKQTICCVQFEQRIGGLDECS